MFPRRSYHARLRARGVQGTLPPGRELSPPPGQQGGLGGGTPPMFGIKKFPLCRKSRILQSKESRHHQIFKQRMVDAADAEFILADAAFSNKRHESGVCEAEDVGSPRPF